MTLTQAPFVSKHLSALPSGILQFLESAGQVDFLSAYNASGGTVYVHLFDQEGYPEDGTAPSFAPVPLPAGTYYESDTPRGFRHACWVCLSNTAATFTAAGINIYLDAGGRHH